MIKIPRQKKQQTQSESNKDEELPSAIKEGSEEEELLLNDIEDDGEENNEDNDSIDETIDDIEEEEEENKLRRPPQQPDKEEGEHLTEDELESIIDDSIPEVLETVDKEELVPELPITEESHIISSSALEEINEEHKFEQRLKSIAYLVEYTKGTWRMIDEVADKIGISDKTANNYLKEYIEIVKQGFKDKTYPDNVLLFYNEGIEDENKKLKYHHMDKLKELVKRYSKYDVNAYLRQQHKNKTLNSDGNDTFISNKRVALDDNNPLSLLAGHTQQQQPHHQQQQIINEPSTVFSNDIDHLQDGITALQLIRFGLVQVFGQPAKIKIGLLLGENPTPYLMDEQKMKKLLIMSGATESRAEYFIDWLKTNAHYVAHPQGFLAYGSSSFSGVGNSSGGNLQGGPQYSTGGYQNGNSGGPDPMTDYYYQMGIYVRGFPPEHPINREALKEYREQKREDEQMKSIDKRLNMAIRTKMMESFQDMGGNKNSSSLFSPEMMLMLGIGQYRQTGTDPDGKPVFGIVPNFGAFGSGQQQTGPVTSPTDQMTSMMAMMKEMMGFMASMNKGDPAQQNFMTTVMGGLAQKIFEPQTNKMQEVMETAKLLQELKGPQVPVNTMGAVMDPEVIIKTKRMELDKEFGMRRLDLEQQNINLQKERLAMQDKEANANLEKIMEGVTSFAPTLLGMAQQFIMGNRGGQGQPGQAEQQQAAAAAANNPAQVLLKMEYEKQRQQAAMEAERKRMEWEAELARKNADYPPPSQNPMWNPQPQQPQQPQQPETQKVEIKEPVVHHPKQREPETYNEETFLPFSPDELEDALMKAEKQKKRLEEYMATVGSVLQNKILNGEGSEQPQPQQQIIVSPSPSPSDETEYKEEQSEQDFTEMLDNYPSDVVDPDYSGPTSGSDGQQQEEEVDIENKKINEEEQVDI